MQQKMRDIDVNRNAFEEPPLTGLFTRCCSAGDVEFVVGLPVYIQTVVCTRTADLYAVSLTNYDRLVVHNRHNKAAAQQVLVIFDCDTAERFLR